MLKFVFDDLQHLLISMARSIKYFHKVELLYPSGSSTCLHVHIQSHDTFGQQKAGDWIWKCEHVEICQICLLLFCLNKYQFWFLLMLRTSLAEVRRRKKTLQGNTNCLAPNTTANERYLPYLQLCGNALILILCVKVAES